MRRLLCFFLLSLLTTISQADYLSAMKATPVADGVYAILTPARDIPNPENKGWNSNSAFVVTQTGVLLIDTGSSAAIGEALQAAIRQVTDKPVKWIVNSHAHGDHWLGNIAFKESSPEIFSTSRVDEIIKSEGTVWIDRFSRLTEGATGKTPVLRPNKMIDQRTELTLGGTDVVLFPSGNSHSPGDLITWLPGQRILISGDVVYSDRMPSTNVSNLNQWIVMLDELIQLGPVSVIPGHGKLTDVEGLQRLRDFLSAFYGAVKKGYEAGLSDFEMLPSVTSELVKYEPYYPGFEEKLARDISHVMLQIEAEEFK